VLTARATITPTSANDIVAWAIINSFARLEIGIASVGLKAVLAVKATKR
jgi:hypothetical protein